MELQPEEMAPGTDNGYQAQEPEIKKAKILTKSIKKQCVIKTLLIAPF